MKFVLNEDKKFILNERFILNEADDEINLDTLKKEIEEVAANIDLDKNTDNSSWGEGWEDLYKACLASKDIPTATNKFWNGGLPTSIKDMSEIDRTKNLPIVSEQESKGYFIGEWGEADSKIIKNIQAALTEEIDSFGWNEKTNPFIYYLKVLQQTKKLQKLTKDTYHYIHNAFIDKHLTKDDIFGKGTFGSLNLIFTDSFLALAVSGADYLDNQNWLAKNYTNLGVENLSATTALLNIFDASGDLQDISATPKVKIITTLRPLAEIKAFTKTKGKKEVNNTEKETATDDEVQTIINMHKSDFKDVLAYLTLQYRKQEWFKTLDSAILTKLKNNQATTSLSFEELDKYDKEFNKKFTLKQLKDLFIGLSQEL